LITLFLSAQLASVVRQVAEDTIDATAAPAFGKEVATPAFSRGMLRGAKRGEPFSLSGSVLSWTLNFNFGLKLVRTGERRGLGRDVALASGRRRLC
jgi:hypothetical protein